MTKNPEQTEACVAFCCTAAREIFALFLDGLLTDQQTHMLASMMHLRADRSVYGVTSKRVQPVDNGLNKLLTEAELLFNSRPAA